MPRLNQYISQATPQGTVRGVIPDSPNVGGLVAGITRASNTIQNESYRREEMMAQERDKIATEEAQAAVSKTMSEGRAYWTEQITNAQQNTPDAAGFTVDTLKSFEGWAQKAVESAPENAKAILSRRLEDLKLSVHEKAFAFEADARRAKVVTDFSTGLDADRRTVQADPTQFQPVLAARLAAASQLVLDPQTKAKVLDSTRESLAYDAAGGIVDSNPDAFLAMAGMSGGKTGKDGKPIPTDPAKAAEAVKNNPILSNLKPEALHQLTERATMLVVTRNAQIEAEKERQRARAEAAANKADREAGRAYTILGDMVKDGRAIDPTNPRNRVLMQQMQRVPEYANAFKTMAVDAQQNAAAATLPITDQRAQLNILYARRNTAGTSEGLNDEIKRREQVLSSAEKDYKEDPLTAAADRGILNTVAPLDMSTPESMAQGLVARVQQADTVAMQVGRFVSPLTAAETRKWADDLAKMPTSEKEKQLATMTNTIGIERMAPLLAQVGKDNIRLAVAGGIAGSKTSAGRSVSRVILEGDAILKAKQFKMPSDGRVLDEFTKQVGEALPTLEAKGAAMEAAQAIYAKLRVESGHASDTAVNSDAWHSAISQVTGGVVDWNGRKILSAGYGVSGSDTRALLRRVDASQVKSWGGVHGMTDEQAAEFIRDSQLQSLAPGRYNVMAGASILQRKDGQPFEMVFK